MRPKKLVIRKPISQMTQIILGICAVLALFAFYEYLSIRQHQKNATDTTMPGVVDIYHGMIEITTPGKHPPHKIKLLEDVQATAGRYAGGMAIGIIFSLITGLLMACFAHIEALLHPVLSFFSKIPPTAMLAVFFILFGTEYKMFAMMIAFGIIPALTMTVYQSAKYDVPDELVNKAYTLGASNFEVVWNVILRQIMPRVIEAVRLAVGPAMVFLIAAEWAVADVGFGYTLRLDSRMQHMNIVYNYIIILGLLGYFLDWSLTLLRRKMCPWFDNGK
jgi:NitT/TauT family transport system permease protein